MDVRTTQGREEIEAEMEKVADDDCAWLFGLMLDAFSYIEKLEPIAQAVKAEHECEHTGPLSGSWSHCNKACDLLGALASNEVKDAREGGK